MTGSNKKRVGVFAAALLCTLASYAQAQSSCDNAVAKPTCVTKSDTTDDPKFDLKNDCTDYDVTLRLSAPDMTEITFNLLKGQAFSSTILPDIPDSDVDKLTKAKENNNLSIDCCPHSSSTTQCGPGNDAAGNPAS